MESTISRSKTKIVSLLFFLSLVIFPFGQLPALFFSQAGLSFRLHLLDVLVLLIFLVNIFMAKKPWSKEISVLIVVAFFSFLMSLFTGRATLVGFLYLIRLASYLCLSQVVFWLVKSRQLSKNKLIQALIVLSVCVAIFGLIQYLFLPDLTAMKFFGWDDHYYRLVSTFLDPAFTGIILVLGINLVLVKKESFKYFLLFVLGVSLALTFSRASFLALIASFVFLTIQKENLKSMAFVIVVLFLAIIFAPKPAGEGVKLTRTSSITQKLDNYKFSLEIVKNEPLFGVGFNNICEYKTGEEKKDNSCAGLDNSLLFVWATTGVVGLASFIYFFNKLYILKPIRPSLIAILVHAQFTNTFFYAWVMFWLMLLWGASKADNSP